MKEQGSYVLKELRTKSDEEAVDRPPPPPAPPIPPPVPRNIADLDLTGYGASALMAFNGVMTGLRGGYMVQTGLLSGILGAWSADLRSKSPANAYFGAWCWAATSLQFAMHIFSKQKSPIFMSATVLCATSLGMTGKYYYEHLQYEMKTEAEKEADNPW